MTEIYITDIQDEIQAEIISTTIQNENPALKLHFDLHATALSFPCGHTILKIEADKINSENIMAIVRNSGFQCEILEDKVCA
jgi:hypothetical protein